MANNKLDATQQISLSTLLAMQKQFDVLVFKGVDHQLCSVIKDQLLDAKVKLSKKLSAEEIEEFCKIQAQIIKLENNQSQ